VSIVDNFPINALLIVEIKGVEVKAAYLRLVALVANRRRKIVGLNITIVARDVFAYLSGCLCRYSCRRSTLGIIAPI
jgi:hypothetical protein